LASSQKQMGQLTDCPSVVSFDMQAAGGAFVEDAASPLQILFL
jgi:hypothetical protein